ncbi:hypothetical protein [Nocardioides flavescens]|uniref:Uncharacterized protein n=1 Tax=Nocardioides flavescens TaxID=2691959 RepID=A0A6L7F395_9ACTN|nr:hypothetical protein [Nocardioides flavescens]MXG91504.1 hypothetical protein [Nocardioides flavescens]
MFTLYCKRRRTALRYQPFGRAGSIGEVVVGLYLVFDLSRGSLPLTNWFVIVGFGFAGLLVASGAFGLVSTHTSTRERRTQPRALEPRDP